ncbi:hypothetical protein VP1G_07745 [Cytospora mali]|uniref:Rhodopsin domain-containing protein n=1 Tax=Cytospora mali TaxID=578113 RepID=A0A194V9B2_CYTMA|nr:hypothetical protein VP1G_07745 [Valsa mali var. pyri (nom. inval.)]
MIWLTVAWGLALTFTTAFQCTPVSAFWETFDGEHSSFCVSIQHFYLAVAVSDLILDIMILLLPIPPVWALQIPMRQKLAVGGTFFLGSIVVASGIARLVIFQEVISFAEAETPQYFSDVTWYNAGTLFWHLTENVVALMGCCLPTYKPLFRGLLVNITTTSSSARSNSRQMTLQPGSSYHRQQDDDEWPLALPNHPGSRFVSLTGSASNISESHLLQAIPQNRIMVQREFRADSSII